MGAEDVLPARITDRLVAVGECLEWQGARHPNGYGQIWWQRSLKRVHRIVLELVEGRPLAPGEKALHHCDNPPCARPEHLFRGSQADNLADMRAKRGPVGFIDPARRLRGEQHPRAKLTVELAERIRATYAAGDVTQKTLGRRYGVAQSQIWLVLSGRRWNQPKEVVL